MYVCVVFVCHKNVFKNGYPSEFFEGGGNVAQLVRASDHHAAEAGSIPQCARDFSPTVNFQCRLSYVCPHTPMCNRMH